jgi:hypothetical protein
MFSHDFLAMIYAFSQVSFGARIFRFELNMIYPPFSSVIQDSAADPNQQVHITEVAPRAQETSGAVRDAIPSPTGAVPQP